MLNNNKYSIKSYNPCLKKIKTILINNSLVCNLHAQIHCGYLYVICVHNLTLCFKNVCLTIALKTYIKVHLKIYKTSFKGYLIHLNLYSFKKLRHLLTKTFQKIKLNYTHIARKLQTTTIHNQVVLVKLIKLK
jgi:hypothetical protein